MFKNRRRTTLESRMVKRSNQRVGDTHCKVKQTAAKKRKIDSGQCMVRKSRKDSVDMFINEEGRKMICNEISSFYVILCNQDGENRNLGA